MTTKHILKIYKLFRLINKTKNNKIILILATTNQKHFLESRHRANDKNLLKTNNNSLKFKIKTNNLKSSCKLFFNKKTIIVNNYKTHYLKIFAFPLGNSTKNYKSVIQLIELLKNILDFKGSMVLLDVLQNKFSKIDSLYEGAELFEYDLQLDSNQQIINNQYFHNSSVFDFTYSITNYIKNNYHNKNNNINNFLLGALIINQNSNLNKSLFNYFINSKELIYTQQIEFNSFYQYRHSCLKTISKIQKFRILIILYLFKKFYKIINYNFKLILKLTKFSNNNNLY